MKSVISPRALREMIQRTRRKTTNRDILTILDECERLSRLHSPPVKKKLTEIAELIDASED